MKILYIGWGDHIHVRRWANQFATRGENVTVFSVSELGDYVPGVRQLKHYFQHKGIAVQHLWLWMVLKLVRPDVIHVHWLNFLPLVPSSWKGPIVVTGWGSDLYQQHSLSPKTQRAFDQNLTKVDWFTVDSADQKTVLVEKFSVAEEKISVVQWGVDLKSFRPGCAFSDRENVIYSCRNLAPIYNQDVVVKAFSQVLKVVPDAKLILKEHHAEEGPWALVMGLIDELGLHDAIEILPSIPYEELPSVYQRSKACVSIATTDGTPMTVLEAMACGSLPVFSDLPSLREWVVDGENGFLSDPKDENELAQKLIAALTMEASEATAKIESNKSLVKESADHQAHMDSVHARYRVIVGHD